MKAASGIAPNSSVNALIPVMTDTKGKSLPTHRPKFPESRPESPFHFQHKTYLMVFIVQAKVSLIEELSTGQEV